MIAATIPSQIEVPPNPLDENENCILDPKFAVEKLGGLYPLTIAYRMHGGGDGQWWDEAIWIGQGCKDPVHSDTILPDGRIYTATTDNGVCFITRNYAAEAHLWWFEQLWIDRPTALKVMKRAIFNVMEKEAHNYSFPKERPWGYDWGAVFMFGKIPFAHPSENDWFCSETTEDLLITGDLLFNPPQTPLILPYELSKQKKHGNGPVGNFPYKFTDIDAALNWYKR